MPNGHLRTFVPAAELALSTPDRLIIKTNLTYAVRTEKIQHVFFQVSSFYFGCRVSK